jgi:RND family efflux transporter MFP subunit
MKTTAHTFIANLFALRPLRLGACVLLAYGMAHTAAAQGVVVPTITVQTSQAGASYELDALIEPVKQSTVSAQASGRVTAMKVKAGDPVRKGQLLATIDDQEASVGTQRSQAQINQADAELRNAQAQWERTKDLQSKGFVSKAALDVASAQLQSAQAQRDQASAAGRQSNLAQGFTKVMAPFDGYVLQTLAEAGDLAVPGKPLLTLYAPLPLRAVVQVPASRAQLARTATSVQVQVAPDAGASSAWITPTAKTMVPSSDPVSQTSEWRLDLPAASSANLLPGQQTRVRFTLAQTATSSNTNAALTVPEAAIVRRGELTAVYVVAGNTFALRAVRTGASTAQGVEVLAGLRAGERVALDPIRAGMANAVPAAATATNPTK